jgi:hypothetical protein
MRRLFKKHFSGSIYGSIFMEVELRYEVSLLGSCYV